MASEKFKTSQVGNERAGEVRKRNPSVGVVLKPEMFQKLIQFAKEDGPRPSTLASLLLDWALQIRQQVGSYRALRDAPLPTLGRMPPLPTGKPVRQLSSEEKDDILRQYSDTQQGIEMVCELALLGHDGAAQVLSDCAAKLNRRGVDWLRMKYLKK